MIENTVDILLVEDNPNDVELTLRALKKCDASNCIEVVRDGAEALEFIFCTDRYRGRRIEDRPRLILLDLKLPLVDGLELLQIVKADEWTRSIPTVVFTSSRQKRDLYESYRLGANSYIVKPVDFEQFSEAVRSLEHYWVTLNECVTS